MTRLVIATRGSALALWQAEHVRARLIAADPDLQVELNVIKTMGDRILDVALAKVGGKGLFVKEIEAALQTGDADVAVHSMKDLPPDLADGLTLAAVGAAADPRDAWCSGDGTSLHDIAHGARVGTSSMRRQCQLLAVRPDLQIALLRGNVPTRLAKLDAGEFAAIVLAAAGLTRLGLAARITTHLEPELCLPAVAQGVLAIETRDDAHAVTARIKAALHEPETARRVACERGFLRAMGGSCQTPLAAHATVGPDGRLHARALCGTPDGQRILRADGVSTDATDAAAIQLGHQLAHALRALGADEILRQTAAM